MIQRPTGHELLDDPAADPFLVRRSLRNIARSNRLFGGTAAVLWGLDRLLSLDPPRTTHHAPVLLDIGTGAGDIPLAARRWGADRGILLRTIGLERLRPAAQLARSPALPMILGCVSALPFRSGSVDVVVISQLLHHLDTDAAMALLRDATRVARRGVVVADLLRSGAAATLFGMASRVLGFDIHTREDGITSVGRGYRVEELEALCRTARIAATVAERPGWRIVAWWHAA